MGLPVMPNEALALSATPPCSSTDSMAPLTDRALSAPSSLTS